MIRMLTLLGLYCLGQSLAFAQIKIHVLDAEGQAVPNAVVSIPIEANSLPSEASNDELPSLIMDQVDKQFSPHVLIVKPEQSVVFPNSDQVRHHVYSFSKPNDFEIRLYSGDQAEPIQFSHPGVVVLGCNIHDQMVGYLYVQGKEISRLSDAAGFVEFDESLLSGIEDQLTVSVWHSRLSSNKTERLVQTLSKKEAGRDWTIHLNLLPEVQKTSRKFKLRY